MRVLAFRSQRVEVTGEVKTPGPLSVSDVPLSLVDAITRSGGTNPDADLQRVRLTRDKKLYILDANGLLDRGDTTQNVLLQSGDVINVPDRTDSRIFVMGEVKAPATVSMLKGRLTIADALTSAGGILGHDANPRQIFVMRGMRDNPTSPEIYRLDMTQPGRRDADLAIPAEAAGRGLRRHCRVDDVQPSDTASAADIAVHLLHQGTDELIV